MLDNGSGCALTADVARPRFLHMTSPLLKLHLGAFNCPQEGWYNTDITPHIWVTMVPGLPQLLRKMGRITQARLEEHEQGVFKKLHYLNVTKRFPLADNSCQCVFSSHMFEHIFVWDVPLLLCEILRVLAPGGVVRFVIPSLDHYVKLYDPEDPTAMLLGILEYDGTGVKNRHQWMYTEPSLCKLLEKHGFVNARACKYREGKCADLERIDNRPENSIYVEAEKAG
jgi:SAM-dependent methyltransferase